MKLANRPVIALLGLGLFSSVSADADCWPFRRHKQECPVIVPAPAVTHPRQMEAKPAKPDAKPEVKPEPMPEPVLTDERFAALSAETVALAVPNHLGDFAGAPSCRFVTRVQQIPIPNPSPGLPGSFVTSVRTDCVKEVSAVRNFKIADNQNVRPEDRVFVNFNYFDPIFRSVNERFNSPVTVPEIYRESFGVEKTFCNGNASVQLRLPITTVNTEDVIPGAGLGGSDTEAGDLTLISKFILAGDDRHYLISAGLAVTLPTGDDSIDPITFDTYHSTTFQPFLGYLFRHGRCFLHGFFAVDIPTDDRDATLLFNDIGVGYFLLDNPGGALSAIVPTFEVHVTNPVNHKNVFDPLDPSGTPDIVVLTGGVTFEFGGSTTLAVGVGTPVTGPQPFDLEVLVQLNWRFGPGPRAALPTGP